MIFLSAAQFTFNRERDINLSSYMEEGIPEEEDESDPEGLSDSGRDNFKLDDVEQGKSLCTNDNFLPRNHRHLCLT